MKTITKEQYKQLCSMAENHHASIMSTWSDIENFLKADIKIDGVCLNIYESRNFSIDLDENDHLVNIKQPVSSDSSFDEMCSLYEILDKDVEEKSEEEIKLQALECKIEDISKIIESMVSKKSSIVEEFKHRLDHVPHTNDEVRVMRGTMDECIVDLARLRAIQKIIIQSRNYE